MPVSADAGVPIDDSAEVSASGCDLPVPMPVPMDDSADASRRSAKDASAPMDAGADAVLYVDSPVRRAMNATCQWSVPMMPVRSYAWIFGFILYLR